MKNLGSHYLAEFFNCNESKVNDIEFIKKIMTEAAEISRATVIEPFFHKFTPHGISGVIVIAESHFAIHTWPEYSYAAVDLFSCSDFDYKGALNHLRIGIEAKKYSVYVVKRGLLPDRDGQAGQMELKMIEIE